MSFSIERPFEVARLAGLLGWLDWLALLGPFLLLPGWAGLAWPSGGGCCFSHLSFVGGAVGVLGAAVSSLSSC